MNFEQHIYCLLICFLFEKQVICMKWLGIDLFAVFGVWTCPWNSAIPCESCAKMFIPFGKIVIYNLCRCSVLQISYFKITFFFLWKNQGWRTIVLFIRLSISKWKVRCLLMSYFLYFTATLRHSVVLHNALVGFCVHYIEENTTWL